MHILSVDWSEPNLLHGNGFGTTRGLPLWQMGQAARIAMVITTQTEGETLDEPVAIVPPPVRNPMEGVLVASALWIDESTQRKTRSSWDWRWWPGDWNAVYFKVQVVRYIGGDDPIALRESVFRFSGDPVAASGDPGDPLTWAPLPGSGGEFIGFPDDAAEGQPIDDYIRVIHPILPPFVPSSDDLMGGVLQPMESRENSFPFNTLPLPLPDHLGYFRAFTTIGGLRLNISGPARP